jgi:hypothetical protein
VVYTVIMVLPGGGKEFFEERWFVVVTGEGKEWQAELSEELLSVGIGGLGSNRGHPVRFDGGIREVS